MPTGTSPPDAREVAEAIVRYWQCHPQAVDTAQGIQRWWLLPRVGEISLHTVEAALARLESEGLIRKQESDWSPATWALVARPPQD